MDIKDLQKAWSRLSADSPGLPLLNEEQIRNMLSKRSKNLMERIDFNIRAGVIVLLLIIIPLLIYDFFSFSGPLDSAGIHPATPLWLVWMDLGVNLLIIFLLVTFLIQYYKTRRQCRDVCDLRHSLLKIIKILTLYKQLFTLALVVILLESATGFIAGFYTSVHANNTAEGFFIPVLISGVLLLLLISWLVFLLLRWIFRKVFGNYLHQLRETLAELDEL